MDKLGCIVSMDGGVLGVAVDDGLMPRLSHAPCGVGILRKM